MPELPEAENIARHSAPRRKHEHLVIKLSGLGKGRLANKREK
jgi:hypothetical protein